MNPSAVAVIATLSSLFGPQEDRRVDRRQFFRLTGGAIGGAVASGFLAHPLLQAAVLDRPDGLLIAPSEVVTEPVLFQTEMYDLARQFAMLCGQRWGHDDEFRGRRRRQPWGSSDARNPVTVMVHANMSACEWDALLHPAVSELQANLLSQSIPLFRQIEHLPRIASMDDPKVETGMAIDPVTGLTARASRAHVRGSTGYGQQTIVHLEIVGRQYEDARHPARQRS